MSLTNKYQLLLVRIITPMVYSKAFQLTVLHTNDIHARIEETNTNCGNCKPEASGSFNNCTTLKYKFISYCSYILLYKNNNIYRPNTYFSIFLLARGECYGGVARLLGTVKKIRESEPNVIFLNAGDMFQGTLWYSIFKWRRIAQFMNRLNFTASVRFNLNSFTLH